MIANCQSDTSAFFGQIHQSSHNLIAFSLPMPGYQTLKAPPVNKVSNEINVLRLMSIEEFEQSLNP